MMKITNLLQPSVKNLIQDGVEIESPIPGTVPLAVAISEDRIIVIFQWATGGTKGLPTGNAFAFDRMGKLLYAIEPYTPTVENEFFSDRYFAMAVNAENQLGLQTSVGHWARVDLETGKIEKINIGRPW